MNEIVQALLGALLGSGLVSVIARYGLMKFVDALGRIPEQEWFDNVTKQVNKMPSEAWFAFADKQLALIPELPSKATLDLMITNFTLTVTEKEGLEKKIDALANELRRSIDDVRKDVDRLMLP